MRDRLSPGRPLLALAALALGCFNPAPQAGLACSETGQCPPGQSCAGGICQVCPAGGCPMSDAMGPDAMPICDNATCTEVCGDANQDGAFDAADVTDLGRLLAGEIALCTCGNQDADLDRDGDVDSRDAAFAQGLLDGDLTDGCASCLDCGDADLDGNVDDDDRGAVTSLVGHGTITVCQFAVADVDANGIIEDYDAKVLREVIQDHITGACQPCDDTPCGDVDLDGVVNGSDISAFDSFPTPSTMCQFVAADLDRTAEIDGQDKAISAATQADANIDLVCEQQCTKVCGDFDQNGAVETGDVTALYAFADGPASSIDQCEFDGGNLRRDNAINFRDWSLLDNQRNGRVTGICAPCNGVCGDANQDGTVTAADATLADQWRQSMSLPALACGWDAADLDGDGAISTNEVADIMGLSPVCQDWLDFL